MSPAKSSAKRGASVPSDEALNTSDREVTREPENDQVSDDSNTMRGDTIDNTDSDRSTDNLDERIRQRAYELYCLRRDASGDGNYHSSDSNHLDDWYAAERELREVDVASHPTVERLNAPTQGTPPTIFEQLSADNSPHVRGL